MTKKIKKIIFYKKKIYIYIYSTDDIDVNNILVSEKEPYGNKNSVKYFIGYNENNIIRPLYIRLSQMTAYARKFDENATLSFIVKNKQLLKNYIKIWGKIENLMKIKFESNPADGDDVKYIKTKIKTYAGSIITDFHNKKLPKEKAPCKCLLIKMIDSVIKANKKYYPQTLLEECKYIQEKIKIENSESDSNNETESDIDNEE